MATRARKTEPAPADQITSACLAGRTHLLNRTITGLYDDALRPLGVTAGQLTALSFIDKYGPIAPGELARRLRMEKSTVSRNLARMQRNGWIRIEAGPTGHTQIVQIKPRGRTVIEKALPLWQEAQAATRSLLGRDGTRAIVAAFERMRKQDPG